jgi:RNA polymerase sigma-70 factor (ECF subfamily)
MHPAQWQSEQFEQNRAHLESVAYRMLGSKAEADDALQEAWLRVSQADTAAVENMRGWLTVVVSRICLDMLRARRARREELAGDVLPEPILTFDGRDALAEADPESEAVMADSVGLALLVVLETLSPAERLAFVLHDTFAIPFEEIAPIVGRSVEATRQLASRARRRVRGAEPDATAADLARQREVVDAFLAASRGGDFDGLLAVLDPDVTFRVDRGRLLPQGSFEVSGARAVAATVLERGTPFAHLGRPAVVNGGAGVVVVSRGRVTAVVAFGMESGRIRSLDVLADPERLRDVRV